MEVDITSNVEVRGSACPYVSRGGLKLEKALRNFGVDPTGYVCSDSGCVYGRIYRLSAPAGRQQGLCHRRRLRTAGSGKSATNPRVVVMERTNIRYVTPEDWGSRSIFP